MYDDMKERFYNGFGENKAEAFHNAMQFAIENNEPESVLEMLYDCQNILRGENDFIHAVEVEYFRLNAEIRGFKYECYFHIECL